MICGFSFLNKKILNNMAQVFFSERKRIDIEVLDYYSFKNLLVRYSILLYKEVFLLYWYYIWKKKKKKKLFYLEK